MKKFFAVLTVSLCLVCPVSAQVQKDTELHRVIGGLYSLVSAVNMNGSINPGTAQLRRYFVNVPSDWKINITRANNAVWAGVYVGKYSSARHYLRSHARELGIMDSPGGYAWLGGEYAWLKAGDISGDTLKPVKLRASRGAGSDSGVIFFSAPDQEDWWQGNPDFGENTAKSIIDMYGVKDAPELHKPEGVSTSVYESVKPSSVGLPGKMRISNPKSSFDMSIEMGDVLFNPIPNTRR